MDPQSTTVPASNDPFTQPPPMATTGAQGGDGGRVAEVKDAATSAAGETASTAAEQAKHVAGEAAQQVRSVADEAKHQASELTKRARQELRNEAETRSQTAAGSMRTLADQLQALAQGRTEEAGPLVGYLQDTGSRVSQFASRIDQRGLEGVATDVAQFARRRPGLFLLAAAGVGFAAGRLVRGARAANGAGSSTAGQLAPADPFDPYLPVPPDVAVIEETTLVTGTTMP